jgi:uncharacterized hydrophobic protein (TIGR00271 family)
MRIAGAARRDPVRAIRPGHNGEPPVACPSMSKIRAFWLSLLHWRRDHLVAACDRIGVLEHVYEEGRLAPRYVFMTVMSCGIATLGLLQDSAAVIIGAMLISPLMGPIIELGMGLATFDFVSVRSALKTMGIGMAVALATAVAIVLVSPLQEATPEILSRTEPTLFDLLVAIFSGLAGAYATITRKGETIVGVAIATALMPPLAVAGYGLAVSNMHVAGGAAFLFMTNLLAISLSATMVAKLYGFGGSDTPKQSAWQAMLIVAVFGLLALPLGLGLRKIANQSLVEHAVRQALDSAAARTAGRVTTVRVDLRRGAADIDAVLMTPIHLPGLQQAVESALHSSLDMPVHLNLREVLTTDAENLARDEATIAELRDSVAELRTAATQRTRVLDAKQARMDALRNSVLQSLGGFETRVGDPVLRFRLRAGTGMSLQHAFDLEQALRHGDGLQDVIVVPPPMPLAVVHFNADADTLDAAATHALELDAWALRRLDVPAITLTGYGRRDRIAQARLATVTTWLQDNGIQVAASHASTNPRKPSPGDEADVANTVVPTFD